jgi:hypothetical protein
MIESSSSYCVVCNNICPKTYHFDAQACDACAAFFRRTVSERQRYICRNTAASCKIERGLLSFFYYDLYFVSFNSWVFLFCRNSIPEHVPCLQISKVSRCWNEDRKYVYRIYSNKPRISISPVRGRGGHLGVGTGGTECTSQRLGKNRRCQQTCLNRRRVFRFAGNVGFYPRAARYILYLLYQARR